MATEWCVECADQRHGTHPDHDGYTWDDEARAYSQEMYRLGIHPSQDRD